MSFLFEINNKTVYPKPEILLIPIFSEIWERDKSKDKEIAIKEFSFIEFSSSMLKSNPFREYPDNKKESILIETLFKGIKWSPDALIKGAIDTIKQWETEGSISYTYWISNKNAAEKMIDFFNSFDLSAVNPKTFMPIYKPKDITSAIKDAESVLKTLAVLKDKVDEEIYDSIKTKSAKTVSPFSQL